MLKITEKNKDAVYYVGTIPAEGVAQLEILKEEGFKKSSTVLEIGCGALVASVPIIEYVSKGNYTGIDPNAWLWEASLKNKAVKELVEKKAATLGANADFTTGTKDKFDYIISHSVVTHCSDANLIEFAQGTAKNSHKDTILLFSCLLCDTPVTASEWQYPGSRTFTLEQIKEAFKGKKVEVMPAYTDIVVKAHYSAVHNWIKVTNKKSKK